MSHEPFYAVVADLEAARRELEAVRSQLGTVEIERDHWKSESRLADARAMASLRDHIAEVERKAMRSERAYRDVVRSLQTHERCPWRINAEAHQATIARLEKQLEDARTVTVVRFDHDQLVTLFHMIRGDGR